MWNHSIRHSTVGCREAVFNWPVCHPQPVVWKARYWTRYEPGTHSVWISCGAQVVGQLLVGVTGPVGANEFTLKLNGEPHTVSKNGGTIPLPKGTYAATVDQRVDMSLLKAYTAELTPTSIEVTAAGDYNLNVQFSELPLNMPPVTYTVTFPVTPSAFPYAEARSEDGKFSRRQQLVAGSQSTAVPEFGKVTITFESYQADGKTYNAAALNINAGAIVGAASVTYVAAPVVTPPPVTPPPTSPPQLPNTPPPSTGGKCGEYPNEAPPWVRGGHNTTGQFVEHNGQIWRARHWTTHEPSTASDNWDRCGIKVAGRLLIATAGEVGADNFNLVLNGHDYSIGRNGGTLNLAKKKKKKKKKVLCV
eukprot:Platyproteum_vivax@DN269_c0_g1_i1.p1